MDSAGFVVSSFSTGLGLILSHLNKSKLKHFDNCKQVTTKDFSGFGYKEDIVTSPLPFNFIFNNTPYYLLIKNIIYEIPSYRYNKDKFNNLYMTPETKIFSGNTEFVKSINFGEFKVNQDFVKQYFPKYYLNKDYTFTPSFDINFYSGHIGINGPIWNNLYGLPNDTKLTIIADFENGIIIESDKVNYVGKLSFKQYKKDIEFGYNFSKLITGIGMLGIIGFGFNIFFKT